MFSTESQASSNYLNSSLTVPEFYKIHSNPVETSPSNLTDLRDGLGPDVLLQFSNIQLKLSNGTVTSHLDIPSLRSFCSSQDVSDFAKSLGNILQKWIMPLCEPISSNITTWFLLAVFIFVGLSGFIGNLLTVMVIHRNPSFHSQTNYFLASLAISDLLLILVGVPFDVFFLWKSRFITSPFNGFCEITSTFISWFTFNSILTIVSLTWERLVAICYPFSLKPFFHRDAVIWLIIIIWFISFFPSLFIGLQFKLVIQDFCGHTHVNSNGLGSKCDFVGWSGNYGSGENYTFEVMLFFTFVLPVLFVIYCYIRILRTLNEATFNSFHLNAGSSIVRKHTSSSHTNSTLLNALTEENLPSTINNSNSNTAGNNSDLNARDSFTRSSLRSQRAHKTVMKMLSELVISRGSDRQMR
uniref:G-protein coupled receptors family 1 profile domain-containing protein n=1 Tax=Meloidogyne enterolobii TaxID=390850 RepID=A0A6V7WAB8_MELEN|nr:unnamed protein product [Meloidogyne enterolobii]